jgi:hypothetical protein
MTSDNRMTWGLIIDVLDLLERHGYHAYLDQAPPSPPPEPRRPGRQADPGAVILTGTDISTVLSALYIPAEDNCDRAETCADCADQSCPTCQSRLQAARAYDHLTARLLKATEAQAAHRDQPEPGSSSLSPGHTDPAAGIEAGQ